MVCGDPYCRLPREGGRRFCPEHAANLDRIREEFEAEEKRTKKWKNLAASGKKR